MGTRSTILISLRFRNCHRGHFKSLLLSRRKMATFGSLEEFVKAPRNEPILSYAPGSAERIAVDESMKKFSSTLTDIPIIVGDEEFHNENSKDVTVPFDHAHKIAKFYYADKALLEKAVQNCLHARKKWEKRPLIERARIFYEAGQLVAGKYRADLNASTMLGQAKTYIQAEIDSACELADFFRFNAYFALRLADGYKPISPAGVENEMAYRGLEGFVAAISPFNFTAIGGNLSAAPAVMGNVILWKPSDTSLLSNYLTYRVMREAGLPAGVVNFVPCDGPVFGDYITSHSDLAAINFTGSVATFRHIWQQVGQNIDKFKCFPRLIGECGGKNFHFIHPSADLNVVAPCTLRAAFEYQGQKCSALSRLYVPYSLWPELQRRLLELMQKVILGPPNENGVFLSAVIDRKAFNRIKEHIERAKSKNNLKIIAGGICDDSKGYFIHPTLIECNDPHDKIFTEEIFGPVIVAYPYDDNSCDTVLSAVRSHTSYALTGAVFAQDNAFLELARSVLRESCGNFYVNDKCTGSVVGQQPFGGSALSGTNDKAGGLHYLLRFASPWSIKTSNVAQTEWRYPSMD